MKHAPHTKTPARPVTYGFWNESSLVSKLNRLELSGLTTAMREKNLAATAFSFHSCADKPDHVIPVTFRGETAHFKGEKALGQITDPPLVEISLDEAILLFGQKELQAKENAALIFKNAGEMITSRADLLSIAEFLPEEKRQNLGILP